ncbi:MAG: UbiA family prenyltransferase [Saprospiraceae bacterium]
MKVHTTKSVYPVYSFLFWKAYFVHMRPYLLFVSGIAGATGLAIADPVHDPSWRLWMMFVPFFLGYGFGQALTDCFQTDTDKISSPYRPLSQGIVSINSILYTSIAGLLLSAFLLFWLHWYSFLLSLAAVFGLATYSYVKKNYWFGGPLHNAWIIALLPVMGFFAASESNVTVFPDQYYSIVAITFFSYANFVLIGYLKDIDADAATGYRTFPVVFGWDRTVQLGDLIALVTLFFFWNLDHKNSMELMIGLAASIVVLAGQIYAHLSKNKNETEATIPIVSTVRGFVLLHSSLILRFQPEWLMGVVAFYLLFEMFLFARPARNQI